MNRLVERTFTHGWTPQQTTKASGLLVAAGGAAASGHRGALVLLVADREASRSRAGRRAGVRRWTRRFALGLIAGAFALGAGCAPARPVATYEPTRHPWTVPGRLRIATSYSMRTLNPIFGTTAADAAFSRLFSDVLITEDAHGRLVPDLAAEVPTAENGGISADGLTIRYKLREHVKWQDGQPFTIADVKFTFDAIMNSANDVSSRVGFDNISRVDLPDPRTVVFHLRHRYAPFVTTVFGDGCGILPAHILAREKTINNVAFNSLPVGTGPFRVLRWERGNRIELRRNDGYFMGKPKLESVTIELEPDETTETSLLRAHEIDWVFELSSTAYRTVRRTTNGDVRFVFTPVNGSIALFFNNAKGPTKDIRIRKAIVFALDKAGLARRLTFGTAIVATQDIPSFMWAYDPTLRPTSYDPGRAKSLLADAGYGPAHRLSLDLYYVPSNATQAAVSLQIQSALAAVGIDVRMRGQIRSVFAGSYGSNGTLARGRYDLAISSWFGGLDPDNSYAFACSSVPPGGSNLAYFCDPAMDAAQRAALETYGQSARPRTRGSNASSKAKRRWTFSGGPRTSMRSTLICADSNPIRLSKPGRLAVVDLADCAPRNSSRFSEAEALLNAGFRSPSVER
jgi:peptide/nickel transport system substrate-binding protein